MENVLDKFREVSGANQAAAAILEMLSAGDVCVCYDQESPYVRDLTRALARGGLIITERRISSDQKTDLTQTIIPNQTIRLVVGVGAYWLAETVSAAVRRQNIKCVWVCPYNFFAQHTKACFFSNSGFAIKRTAEFELVFTDTELKKYVSDKTKAGGLGYLLANVLAEFDHILYNLIKNGVYCHSEFKRIITNLDNPLELPIHFSQKSYPTALYCAAFLNKSYPKINVGEAAFLAAYTMIKLYKRFLEYDSVDIFLPKNYQLWGDALIKKYNFDVIKLFQCIKIPTLSEFCKQRHIILEYKTELLELITSLDNLLPSLIKRFRRSYNDAAFFLKNALPNTAVLECVAMGSTISQEVSLLNYIDISGVLDRYLVKCE